MSSAIVDCLAHLDDSTRKQFEILRKDVVFLKAIWSFYLTLFDEPEGKRTVNRFGMFYEIEGALIHAVISAIGRLSDNAGTGDKENLSFNNLVISLTAAKLLSKKEIKSLNLLIKSFWRACKPIKVARNKLVAHCDKETRLSKLSSGHISIESTNHAVRRAELFIWFTGRVLSNGQTSFLSGPSTSQHAESLIYWLNLAWENQPGGPPPTELTGFSAS
jgi:hypothetical protein